MDRTERFYRIDRLLRERRSVGLADFMRELEVSRATLKRDLEYMRSRLHAPIVWDRESGGYRLEGDPGDGRYELPGIWFTPAEVHALLTLQHLVARTGADSLLGPHVPALRSRLAKLLGRGDRDAEEVGRRVRILDVASRRIAPEHFQVVGAALLARRRLRIAHHVREREETIVRVVSPQRLVHYRDNWYLDAWCHLRDGLRSFALDAVRGASVLNDPADEIDDARLDLALGSGYGIFSGSEVAWARLRFTPMRARWVAAERWHPDQRGAFAPDGSYLLELPYSDPRELVMDVLRHGPEVEVLAPDSLRATVAARLGAALARYR